MGNMKIWDAVQATDPAHTKKVNQRGGFTAIDAPWQSMRATETFGPVGEGWGYEVVHDQIHLEDGTCLAVADVIVWHGNRDNAYGPLRGASELRSFDRSGKARVDTDAPKKAVTDALTKGLSHLGFSADVFLGMYDDNKYVQQVTQQVAAQKKQAASDAMPDRAKEIIAALKDIDDAEQLDNAKQAWGSEVQGFKATSPAAYQMIVSEIKKLSDKLSKEK